MTAPCPLPLVESAAILGTRMALGDECTATLLSTENIDPAFVERHPNQLAAIWEAQSESDT